MKRRGVIALLTPLLAGCFGGGAVRRSRRPDPTETPAAATDTPAPTATDTPTPAPTATDTPTPASNEDAANEGEAGEQLAAAREQIRTAVEAYADGESLTDVRADADGFDASEVYVALTRANASVGRAAALAATDDQETAAARLRGVVAFLTHATTAQAGVVEGHDGLVDVRAALSAEDDVGTDGTLDQVRGARDAVEEALSSVERDAEAADTEAVDAVDADAYETKVDQFEAASAVLDGVVDPVATLSNGIVLLRTAQTRAENGDDESAAEDAEEAVEKLERAEEAFDDLRDDVSDAAAFESPLSDLKDLAADRRSEAESLT